MLSDRQHQLVTPSNKRTNSCRVLSFLTTLLVGQRVVPLHCIRQDHITSLIERFQSGAAVVIGR